MWRFFCSGTTSSSVRDVGRMSWPPPAEGRCETQEEPQGRREPRREGCICFALLLTLTPMCSVTPGVSVCTHVCFPSTCSLPAAMQATAGMYRENVVSCCVFITSHLPQVPLGSTEQTHQQTHLNDPSGLKLRDKRFFRLLLGMGPPPGSICPSVWVWDGPPLGPRGTPGCVGTELPDGMRAEALGSLQVSTGEAWPR